MQCASQLLIESTVGHWATRDRGVRGTNPHPLHSWKSVHNFGLAKNLTAYSLLLTTSLTDNMVDRVGASHGIPPRCLWGRGCALRHVGHPREVVNWRVTYRIMCSPRWQSGGWHRKGRRLAVHFDYPGKRWPLWPRWLQEEKWELTGFWYILKVCAWCHDKLEVVTQQSGFKDDSRCECVWVCVRACVSLFFFLTKQL